MKEGNIAVDKVRAKFSKIRTKNETLFLDASGGIFTPKTRKRILGIMKQPEPGTSRNQFWEDRRNQVERALIDLRLFIEKAERDYVNQVITKENLAPVVEALLYPVVHDAELDLNRAEIAQMLVQNGIGYLSRGVRPIAYDMPRVIQRTLQDATELSHVLVSDIKVYTQFQQDERRKELAKTKASEQKEQSPAEPRKGDSKP